MDDQPLSLSPSMSPQTALHLVGDPARPTCVHHWVLGDPAHGVVDHVAWLREKLKAARPKIETVWGVGYKLVPQPAKA